MVLGLLYYLFAGSYSSFPVRYKLHEGRHYASITDCFPSKPRILGL